MRKMLVCSIAVLLYSLVASAQTAKQWKTIQIKTVTGSANVESETLFTPTTAGAYRISATFVDVPAFSTTDCVVGFSWRDQLGTAGAPHINTGASSVWASTVFMFNPVVGKPITYTIEINEGPANYRLEVTLEELE
jgi:hypothetical protein